MLKYKEFKKYINTITRHEKLEDALNDVYRNSHVDASIVGTYSELIQNICDLISINMGLPVEDDWIGYYLYESSYGHRKVIDSDGTEYNLKTLRDLYDMMVVFSKKDN